MPENLPDLPIRQFNDTDKYYIYLITNTANDKIYVGKTVDPKIRLKKHFNNAFASDNIVNIECPKLYNSIRKYGKEKFIFEIIDQYDTETEAYLAEAKYITEYNSIENGMNVSPGGVGVASGENHHFYGKGYLFEGELNPMYGMTGELNPFYGHKHTEESRRQMSETKKGMFAGEKNYFYGKSFSGEKHPRCSITEETAKKIIEEIKSGKKTKEISLLFDVSQDIVGNIKYNKNWKHLPR